VPQVVGQKPFLNIHINTYIYLRDLDYTADALCSLLSALCSLLSALLLPAPCTLHPATAQINAEVSPMTMLENQAVGCNDITLAEIFH